MHCDYFTYSRVAWLFNNQIYSKTFPIFDHILDLQQIRMLLLQPDLFRNISYFAGIATNLCTIHHQQFQHGHVFVSQLIEFWKGKFCAKKYSLCKISNFISKCHMLVLQLAILRREKKLCTSHLPNISNCRFYTELNSAKPNCGQSNLVCPIYKKKHDLILVSQ